MNDTHTLMVGIFVTCWMVLFFGGSAIELRKTYQPPAKPEKGAPKAPAVPPS